MSETITLTARYGTLRVALTLTKSHLSASAAAFAHLRTVLEAAVPDAVGRVLTCAAPPAAAAGPAAPASHPRACALPPPRSAPTQTTP